MLVHVGTCMLTRARSNSYELEETMALVCLPQRSGQWTRAKGLDCRLSLSPQHMPAQELNGEKTD